MTNVRATPLLDFRDHALCRHLAFPMDRYGERFIDVDFWRPYIELIAARHDWRPRHIESGTPGTFPTFVMDRSNVVKLFGAPFDGPRCWEAELEVADALGEVIVGIAIPRVIGAGTLSRAPDWRYIIYRYIEGSSYGRVREHLDGDQRLDIARRLGRMVRRVHDVPVPDRAVLRPDWNDWHAFVVAQQHGIAERHRLWNCLPGHLIPKLDGYVSGYRVDVGGSPSVVHADLHQEHVLVSPGERGDWRISGVIDWGDARTGDPFYELPALHLGLFEGDKAMLGAFLEAYGWSGYRTDAFVHRAMTMTLLHEFNVLDDAPIPADVASLDQLADILWRV